MKIGLRVRKALLVTGLLLQLGTVAGVVMTVSVHRNLAAAIANGLEPDALIAGYGELFRAVVLPFGVGLVGLFLIGYALSRRPSRAL